MIFSIEAPVDLGSKAVTHSTEELKFAIKNSLPFNGLLSNYHAITNKGWSTTNGETISLESLNGDRVTFRHRGKKYRVYNARKVLVSKTSIELPFDEEIKEYYISENGTVYIRTTEHIFRLKNEKNNEHYETVFYIEKGKSCFFTVNKNGVFWYNNAFYDVETLEVLATTDFVFYSNTGEKLREEPNNGYYEKNYWICGYDSTDHSKDWAENINKKSIDFIGHITSTGEAIGEPRPDNLKPTILDNRLIKWDRFSSADMATLKSTNIAQLSSGDEPVLASSSASFGSSYTTPTPIKFAFTYGMNRAGAFMYMERWNETNSWQMTDTTATPGIYWQTEEDDPYSAIFPNASIYTNNIEARGRDYEYGGDWFRCVYNYRLWKVTSSVFSIFSTPVTLFTYNKGKTSTITLDNTNAQAIKKNYSKLNGWVVPTPNSDGTFNIANSTVWFKFNTTDKKWLKHHLFSKNQANSRAWSSWKNTADFKVNDFPMWADIGDGYKVHLYHNLPICISKDNVAITTPTTEMDSVYAVRGDTLVANKNIFRFADITLDNIEVEKIADYKFKTNIVAPLNTFAEKRDGVIELSHSFIPYFNEVKWNGYGSLVLLQCPDGNDYNDTFSMGFGVNATLDDNINETSALLPAISIPFYCNSRNIESFNKQIIDKNAPIMAPDITCIPSDVALGVFFTHSLKTTDIGYRYSVKNGEVYHDDKYDNTQWWIGSTSIFLPLGLGSTFSGINYLASTVELPGNYSVRLYTQNNNSFLLYNIAQQSYYGQTIFTIYGSSYYYDNQGIYYIGDGSTNEFVCYAIGMKFLANSGTEAYFYSPVDKYLYTFTGSNTLTKAVPLCNVPAVKDAVFSSVDQTLFLLFEDDTLYAQNGISSAYFTNFTGVKELQGTVKGCSIVETNKTFHILNPEEGEVVPLQVETEYTGGDDGIWQCPYVDLMLFNNNNEVDLTVTVDMMGTENQSVKKNIHLNKSDFKNDYCKIRVSPKVNNGQGFKVSVYSKSKVSIMSIAPKIERISDAGFVGLNY